MYTKITAIFMATFYMLISVGFSVSIHQCDAAKEIDISFVEDVSCCCAIEKNQNNCCTDEKKIIQWKDNQQIFSSHKIDLKSQSKILVKTDAEIGESAMQEIVCENIDNPPPLERRAFLLFQQFIFYG